jgi:hypothetical protein
VVLLNHSDGPVSLSAFNFEVWDADSTKLVPFAGVDGNLNGNPDFNEFGVLGPWLCSPPDPQPDTGEGGPGQAVSFMSCFSGGDQSVLPLILPGDRITLAMVHYAIPGDARRGEVELTLAWVAAFDHTIAELGSCEPVTTSAAECTGATVRLVR